MLTNDDPNLRLLSIANLVQDDPRDELERALDAYRTMIMSHRDDARAHLARGTTSHRPRPHSHQSESARSSG